jgi:UDP-glucuronate 4-epimerase
MTTRQPILVTGSAGFIGSHVVEALLGRGENVVGVDNFDPYYDIARKRRNVAAGVEFASAPERRQSASGRGTYEPVEADITDAPAMGTLLARVRPAGVIHLAAKAGVRPSIADPVGYARVNVYGTSVLLEAARVTGCARFVLASSSSVYGNSEVVPFAEGHDVSRPISPYASTKRACELLAYTHRHLTGMPTACLRFFTVYGPRQRPDLAIGMFLRLVSRAEPVPMFGDGTTSRDYTYIADIVAGVLAAYDRIDTHGYRIWNLGGSEPVSLKQMIQTISRVLGKPATIEPLPMRQGDVERTFADVRRSEAELGFRARTRFEEGVARQWRWMQEFGEV